MAKKSRRKPAHPQQNNLGCMWGLISLFDFRRGYPTQKLLSDKKHGSTKQTGNEYSRVKLDSLRDSPDKHVSGTLAEEIQDDPLTSGFTSVKALMEEEMSRRPRKKIAGHDVNEVKSNLSIEVIPQNSHRQRSNKLKLISDNQRGNMDVSSSFDGLRFDDMDLMARSSMNLDLAKFLVDFYSYTFQEMHSDSSNKLDLLPAPGIIGRMNPNYLDELDDHLDQKISFFQQSLADLAQAIVCQKSLVEELPNGRCVFHHKEFMDALDSLNSDKELFLKLLHDPDSFLLKYIQNLHGSQGRKISQLGSDRYLENVRLLSEENDSSGKCKESEGNQTLQKQNKYSFFWKKGKSNGRKTSKEIPSSKVLNRIVVLKPKPIGVPDSPAIITPNSLPRSHHVHRHDENGERIISHFSLKEIKRRIQHIIGESRKTQHVVSMDGLLHKIPVRSTGTGDSSKMRNSESAAPSSADKSSCDLKVLSQTLSLDHIKDEKIHSEECEVNINSRTLSSTSRSHFSLYEEAKRHLSEMLNTRTSDLPKVHLSESLERVLSLPRENEVCSISSPRREKDLSKPYEERGDRSLHLQREELVDTKILEILQVKEEDLNNNESTEIIEAVDTVSIMETDQLEVASVSSKDEGTILDKICEEQSSSLFLDSSEEKSRTITLSKLPPAALNKENLMAAESTNEKLDQPSPVSVLETFLPEDITSPASSTMENCEIRVQHEQANYEESDKFWGNAASSDANDCSTDCLDDDEARLDYVKAVLEASGLTYEFSERWDVEDQLLDPPLFDEIGYFFCFLQDDPKLLFDCMNEVLLEIKERLLKCTPWLSFVSQNVLPVTLGESLIREVFKGLEWHRHIQVPNTLDRVIRKDLEGRSCWMDLRHEAENISSKICDKILNDLIDESVYIHFPQLYTTRPCHWDLVEEDSY